MHAYYYVYFPTKKKKKDGASRYLHLCISEYVFVHIKYNTADTQQMQVQSVVCSSEQVVKGCLVFLYSIKW